MKYCGFIKGYAEDYNHVAYELYKDEGSGTI